LIFWLGQETLEVVAMLQSQLGFPVLKNQQGEAYLFPQETGHPRFPGAAGTLLLEAELLLASGLKISAERLIFAAALAPKELGGLFRCNQDAPILPLAETYQSSRQTQVRMESQAHFGLAREQLALDIQGSLV